MMQQNALCQYTVSFVLNCSATPIVLIDVARGERFDDFEDFKDTEKNIQATLLLQLSKVVPKGM